MNAARLKQQIRDLLWATVDTQPFVSSATLTGSFVDSPNLEGMSDIDLVLVVDRLNAQRFTTLQHTFDQALRPTLGQAGYDLLINPTLGPLKFNRPNLAVLHLMIYSEQAHVDHVVHSPFTCLDWQCSGEVRKQSLAEVYPVFGLQPRHFLGARRSAKDYLRDFYAGQISYRELICDAHGYTEQPQAKPMSLRDRHEFAYHVCRFLMRNLLKLLTRRVHAPANPELLEAYFARFPDGADTFGPFFMDLWQKKRQLDFATALPNLEQHLIAFVEAFERQFRRAFFDNARRHIVFRHAPTAFNLGTGAARRFQGRGDAAILPIETNALQELKNALDTTPISRVWSSPARRARQSLAALAQVGQVDERLDELDYGTADGCTVAEVRQRWPELFAAWDRGEDPRFPGGENNADLAQRVRTWVEDHWRGQTENTLTCTHQGVLRYLIGAALGVPQTAWHRLQVPHLRPITFLDTQAFGLFVDFDASIERAVFAGFVPQHAAAA